MTEDYSTVVVTGAAGLIGSAVTRLLLSKNINVIACDNFSIGEWQESHDLITWLKMDICDSRFVKQLSEYNADAVIHCAAHPGGKSLAEPVEDVGINGLASMRLFKWCADSGIPVIFTSSTAIYGDQPQLPIQENAHVNPGTIYGVCKQASENFLKILGKGYGLKWIALRLFAIYGAGHRPSTYQSVVNIMLTQILSGNRVVVKGSLDRTRDFLYVDDAAIAIYKSLCKPEAYGKILNIGTGSPTTIRKLIETLCKVLERPFSGLDIVEEQGTVGDPFYSVACCSKAKDILDFTAQYDLPKGLAEVVRLRKNL